MVRTKDRHMQQTNKMNKYAMVRWPDDLGVAGSAGEMRDQGSELDPPREPLLSKIVATIHDLKGSLEPQLDAVVINVGLLRLTFKKFPTKF
ncbi:hypothetical protein NDU88_002625 [Pleurodeles waltl]|uniref:Uncharacterized protein n=1 Tax=Pleurodeles waltl TaxID=8319 RepID=A0AAV7MPF5_PLEWA|nr:hypothetical protein NDU88_002625 [Pleurodeles waltl]